MCLFTKTRNDLKSSETSQMLVEATFNYKSSLNFEETFI